MKTNLKMNRNAVGYIYIYKKIIINEIIKLTQEQIDHRNYESRYIFISKQTGAHAYMYI